MAAKNLNAHAVEIVQTASAMLAGSLDLVTGSRRICALRHKVNIAGEGLFDPIVAFESDTDIFPIGDLRQQFSPEYLQKLDDDLEEHIKSAKPAVLVACKQIIEAVSQG